MNIITFLLKKFCTLEKNKLVSIIVLSIIINVIYINVISFITANIIQCVQKKDKVKTYKYFKYFIYLSLFFILCYYLYKYLQNKLLIRLRHWIRQELVKIVLDVNNENLSEMNFSQVMVHINRISNNCYQIMYDIFTTTIPDLSLLTAMSVYFLYKNPLLGSIFISGNLVIVGYVMKYWNDMLEKQVKYEKVSYANEYDTIEILNNIDKIISRGQHNNEMDIFSKSIDNCINESFIFHQNNANHNTKMMIIVYCTIFVFMVYLIKLFYNQKVDATTFITFLTIILLYRDRVGSIITQVPDYIDFMGKLEIVTNLFNSMKEDHEQVLKKPRDIYERDENLEFNNIRLEDVSFKYDKNNKQVLDKLNLELELNNNVIGIVGPSGQGKSTISKLLIKLYKYDGNIYIDGKDLKDINTGYIRKNIIYVNQNSRLFDRTLIDNIMYGCYDRDVCINHLEEIKKFPKINAILQKFDLENMKAGQHGENISGGQRQIMNIISGLIIPSKVCILDEPTNALDASLKEDIINVISYFKKYKKAIIVITHDKEVYRIFDKQISIA